MFSKRQLIIISQHSLLQSEFLTESILSLFRGRQKIKSKSNKRKLSSRLQVLHQTIKNSYRLIKLNLRQNSNHLKIRNNPTLLVSAVEPVPKPSITNSTTKVRMMTKVEVKKKKNQVKKLKRSEEVQDMLRQLVKRNRMQKKKKLRNNLRQAQVEGGKYHLHPHLTTNMTMKKQKRLRTLTKKILMKMTMRGHGRIVVIFAGKLEVSYVVKDVHTQHIQDVQV